MTIDARAWRSHVVDAELQALADVSVARAATVSVRISKEPSPPLVSALTRAAQEAGYAVARASLGESSLHTLDEIVRSFANGIRAGDANERRQGILAMLDAFAETHGKRTASRFEERADEVGLGGDLRMLAAGYLASSTGRSEARRLKHWLGLAPGDRLGTELPERPISVGTAKSALAQLSRLALVLDARGTLFLLSDAETLVDLPAGRRDVALTVLRELCDNADGHRGMIASRVVVLGAPSLVLRKHALGSHEALATRLLGLDADVLLPHAGLSYVDPPAEGEAVATAITPTPVDERKAGAMRTMLRLAQGLPPLEVTSDVTVGLELIDKRIDALFETAQSGSVFAVLSGEYGSGKTHHLLHLEARALETRRSVLRLSVERLDEDLGNPQRHLRRLLESSVLPQRGRPSPIDRLQAWLGSERSERKLAATLRALSEGESEASAAAQKALRGATESGLDPGTVVELLAGLDLEDKPAGASYRKDAYGRIHLWLALLERMDETSGTVVVLDEAENLYRPGVSRPERRTALRSLAFYCGGSLENACVVLAVTPDTLEALREESAALLDEIEEQKTLLPSEDVAMLRRRLVKSRPIEVHRLAKADLERLAERARKAHASARGATKDPEFDAFVRETIARSTSPRALLRAVIGRLERLHFSE